MDKANEIILSDMNFRIATMFIQSRDPDAIRTGVTSLEMIELAAFETQKMTLATPDRVIRLKQRLQNHFSVVFDSKALIRGAKDQNWITAEDKANWLHWARYKANLMSGGRSSSVLVAMDAITDKILNILPNPRNGGKWQHKGLVYGDIQSGKTGTMIAMAAKAADAGTKYLIFLTGGEEDLRTQTQRRVDEGLIGATRRSGKRGVVSTVPVGVGEGTTIHMNAVTSFDHDLSNKNNTAIVVSDASAPIVAVVKKNVKVLDNLIKWICGQHGIDPKHTGRTIDHSVLIIDDECDFASVDTNKSSYENVEGSEPTKINSRIRALRNLFDRSVYAGFSATPFANLLMDKDKTTAKDGDDLYPSSFVVSMVNPVNYLGVERLIGFTSRLTGDDAANDQGLPELYSFIDERELEWIPQKHKKGHIVAGPLPPSLQEAIQRFMIVAAIRNEKHNSMLVNLTRFQDVQGRLRTVIEAYVSEFSNALVMDDKTAWEKLRKLYETTMTPNCRSVWERDEYEKREAEALPSWEDLESQILEVCQRMTVKAIHGASEDVLQYIDKERVCVIAVGGQKLSRGITLEGLSISYFGRNTPQADTGLQMGRWFGYRDGYLGLCHLYLSRDTFIGFQRMAETSRDLRDEISYFGDNPDPGNMDLGFNVYPGQRITAPNKMRNAVQVLEGFEGRMPETKIFDTSFEVRKMNKLAVGKFFGSLGNAIAPTKVNGFQKNHPAAKLWLDVEAEAIASFLDDYNTHPDANLVRKELLKGALEDFAIKNAGVNWNVAFMSAKPERSGHYGELSGIPFTPRLRSPDKVYLSTINPERYTDDIGRYVIKRIATEEDELVDVNDELLTKALEIQGFAQREEIDLKDPGKSDIEWRFLRQARAMIGYNGLLLVYPIIPDDKGKHADWKMGDDPFFGFAMIFPGFRKREMRLITHQAFASKYGEVA